MQWKQSVMASLGSRSGIVHYPNFRYEDSIRDAASLLQWICDYVSLDFHPAMLNFYENNPGRLAEHAERHRIVGTLLVNQDQRLERQRLTTQSPDSGRAFAWRTTLTSTERDAFARVAGNLPIQLGDEP
jgi:hypothetical protein